MRIEVKGETELIVSAAGAALEIREAGGHFDSLAMLAASLGACTLAVLAGWAERAHVEVSSLAVVVRWDYVEDPYRVGSFELEIRWPDLPSDRHVVARRVAAACTVKNTLAHPPELRVAVGGS